MYVYIILYDSGSGAQSKEKMLVFYYALTLSGLPELAESAKSALATKFGVHIDRVEDEDFVLK